MAGNHITCFDSLKYHWDGNTIPTYKFRFTVAHKPISALIDVLVIAKNYTREGAHFALRKMQQ